MTDFEIQPAIPEDSADLAILADMATRRLSSFLWNISTSEGQSPFEVGRSMIHNNRDSTLHHSRWQVARSTSGLLGALNGYILGGESVIAPANATARILRPLNELKGLAIDTWYVSAIAVFPEARGMQVGQSLLRSAEQSARAASADEITLMVGSFNPLARKLYEKMGFETRSERKFEPFVKSDRYGRWVLMVKNLKENIE